MNAVSERDEGLVRISIGAIALEVLEGPLGRDPAGVGAKQGMGVPVSCLVDHRPQATCGAPMSHCDRRLPICASCTRSRPHPLRRALPLRRTRPAATPGGDASGSTAAEAGMAMATSPRLQRLEVDAGDCSTRHPRPWQVQRTRAAPPQLTGRM